MQARSCPALMISAPASGQGKTTITAALARLHTNLGRRVRVFKTGPDFIDPMIHSLASGNPCYQLDLWMGGEAYCNAMLFEAAKDADLILIEGVMGLFDGQPSSADLARRFGLPVLAVIDGSAMAQTFGALAHGLASYQADLKLTGAFANRVTNPGHADILQASLPDGMDFYGFLPPDSAFSLPERHLGLVQASELDDIDSKLNAAAKAIQTTGFTQLPPAVSFAPEISSPAPKHLQGCKIAIARDAAFSFIYQANLDLLVDMGAELVFFSPLKDTHLPLADSVYLPGGYPELHAATLSSNQTLAADMQRHHAQHKPILAECGGMLYLTQALTDISGIRHPMLGLLDAETSMQARLGALGLQEMSLNEGKLRGHTFHYSIMSSNETPVAHAKSPNGAKPQEAIFQSGRLTASYVHSYFPSNPDAVARLLKS